MTKENYRADVKVAAATFDFLNEVEKMEDITAQDVDCALAMVIASRTSSDEPRRVEFMKQFHSALEALPRVRKNIAFSS